MKRGTKKRGGAPAAKAGEPKWLTDFWEGRIAPRYKLRLYVAGNNLNSVRAIENVELLCREYLQSRAELEIVDLYQQPALARGDRIVAAPCLVKRCPLPQCRFIGDMSDLGRILLGLGLRIPLPPINGNGLKQKKQS